LCKVMWYAAEVVRVTAIFQVFQGRGDPAASQKSRLSGRALKPVLPLVPGTSLETTCKCSVSINFSICRTPCSGKLELFVDQMNHRCVEKQQRPGDCVLRCPFLTHYYLPNSCVCIGGLKDSNFAPLKRPPSGPFLAKKDVPRGTFPVVSCSQPHF